MREKLLFAGKQDQVYGTIKYGVIFWCEEKKISYSYHR